VVYVSQSDTRRRTFQLSAAKTTTFRRRNGASAADTTKWWFTVTSRHHNGHLTVVCRCRHMPKLSCAVPRRVEPIKFEHWQYEWTHPRNITVLPSDERRYTYPIADRRLSSRSLAPMDSPARPLCSAQSWTLGVINTRSVGPRLTAPDHVRRRRLVL